jgi:hypothetical protein
MAVGDIIADNGLTPAAFVYFQPAGSIQIMILTVCGKGANHDAGIADGVGADAYSALDDGTCKIGITNTKYLVTYNTTAGGYSGIQIK